MMTEQVKKVLSQGPPWLPERTVLVTRSGSFSYGTNVEGSDEDYKGVCIQPEEYFFGLEKFEHYDTTGGNNGVYKGDDISIIALNRFVKDAMDGTPNNIEILFTRPEDILYKDPYGFADELISHRKDFLTKKCKHRMCGYAHSQIQRMLNMRLSNTRQPLIDKYGYDTKLALHAVRLLESCKQILTTGDYSTYRPEREWLKSIRGGLYKLDEAITLVNDLLANVEKLYETSEIPHSPDYHKINAWVMDMNKRALSCNKDLSTRGKTFNELLATWEGVEDKQVEAAKEAVDKLAKGMEI